MSIVSSAQRKNVIPAQAGIHHDPWIPAFAGMTPGYLLTALSVCLIIRLIQAIFFRGLWYHNRMFHRLQVYGAFVKIEHTLFAFPLLFSGAILAAGHLPSWRLSGLIVSAGFGGRTVAFAMNRMIDRHLDRLNPRTAQRELPAGKMSLAEAAGVGLFGGVVYFVSAWAIAPLCLALSPLPLVVFGIYPYLKRFTALAHLGVGLADAMAPLGGWIAVRQSLVGLSPVLWLWAFTFLWVSGFDVIYSTLDEEFDRRQGLFSLPATIGRAKALQMAGILHGLAFVSLMILYFGYLRTAVAFATLLAIGGLLFLEHCRADDVDLAFFRINAVVSVGVLGLVATGVAQPL
jgi:4-hydroxybenzoate polyprenyltransferase